MTYRPRTVRNAWIRDRVLVIVRASPDLTIGDIASELGYHVDDGSAWPPETLARLLPDGLYCWRCNNHHPPPIYRAFSGQTILSVLVGMDRHRELHRWRPDPDAVWRWRLGPNAPPAVDVTCLEALFPNGLGF